MKGCRGSGAARYRERSLWLAGLDESLEPRPALPGATSCDIVIVGAGFTGLWTAYYLKRTQPDLRIVVVEKETAGFGPSGRNGGWVSGGLTGSPAVYRRTGGDDSLRRALAESYRAVDEVGRVARLEGIDCGYMKSGAIILATSEPQLSRLRDEVASAHRLGQGEGIVRLLPPGEANQLVRASGVCGAAFVTNCARINPAILVRGLARTCERLGVKIYEQTEATSLDRGFVRCKVGDVKADVVLRATEAYTTQLPGERRRYLPLYSLMIATEPLADRAWTELGWSDGLLVGDRRHLFFYAQRTIDGRLAIGGRGAPYKMLSPIRSDNERDQAVRERLIRSIRRQFPSAADAEITHHWGGPLAVPRDWSMSVAFNRRCGYGWAGGYTGHGLGAANISGRTLADLVLARDSELVHLPWVNHEGRRWEPEPLRYCASRVIMRVLEGADHYEDSTGRRARRTALLKHVLLPL
jgi:glycine/D-amino acid oxidase-like deaminating enzyme